MTKIKPTLVLFARPTLEVSLKQTRTAGATRRMIT